MTNGDMLHGGPPFAPLKPNQRPQETGATGAGLLHRYVSSAREHLFIFSPDIGVKLWPLWSWSVIWLLCFTASHRSIENHTSNASQFSVTNLWIHVLSDRIGFEGSPVMVKMTLAFNQNGWLCVYFPARVCKTVGFLLIEVKLPSQNEVSKNPGWGSMEPGFRGCEQTCILTRTNMSEREGKFSGMRNPWKGPCIWPRYKEEKSKTISKSLTGTIRRAPKHSTHKCS